MFDQKQALIDLQKIQDEKLISTRDLSKELNLSFWTIRKMRMRPDLEWALLTKRKVRDYIEANRKG